MPTNWTVDEPSKQAFSNVVSLECTFTNYSTIVTTSDTSNLLPGMEAKNASQSLVIVREGGIYRIDSITNSTTFVLSFPAIEGHRAPGETYVHTVEFWSFDFPFSIFFYWQSNMDGLAKGTGWSDAFSVEDYSKFKSVPILFQKSQILFDLYRNSSKIDLDYQMTFNNNSEMIIFSVF